MESIPATLFPTDTKYVGMDSKENVDSSIPEELFNGMLIWSIRLSLENLAWKLVTWLVMR